MFVSKATTPAAGVPTDTPRADSVNSEWAGDTGTHEKMSEDTPVGMQAIDEDAAADMIVEKQRAAARMQHRVKETSQDVKDMKEVATATVTGVQTLRMETKRDISEVNDKVNDIKGDIIEVKGEVKQLSGHVFELVKTVGPLSGQLKEIVKGLDADRDIQRITFETHADVDKAQKISKIKTSQAVGEAKRKVMTKAMVVLLTILGTGGTVLLTHLAENC